MAGGQTQSTQPTIFLYKTNLNQRKIHLSLTPKTGLSFQPASLLMPAVFFLNVLKLLLHKSHD